MSRPHIVLITADQLRKDALGWYGCEAIQTPNLDRLATTGDRYERAYAVSPWCMPSRSSIVTGQYPHVHRAYSNFRDNRLDPDRPNLYTLVRDQGYTTAHIGKCHFAPVPYGQTRPDRTLPYEAFRAYYESLGINHLVLQDDKQVSVWFRDDYAEELDQAGLLDAYRDAVWDKEAAKVFTFPGPAEWHPDSWVGRKSCERIRAADPSTPQFFFISLSGPHFPFDPPAEYLDRVDRDALDDPRVAGELDDPSRIHYRSVHGGPSGGGNWIESGRNDRYDSDYWRRLRLHYFANVALIDDQIGLIRAALEEKFGDNVMIAFHPDHGEMLGNHGIWGKGHCFYDDVVRVPLLLRQPGGRDAGVRSDDLVSLVDIQPTFVTAGGADHPDVDGTSLTRPDRGHRYVYSEGERMAVITDQRYKLVTVHHQEQRFVELFDRDRDPDEITSVAGDPDYAEVERDLQAALAGTLLDAALP